MAALWGADHIVKEKETFIKALKAAEKLAKEKNVIAKVDVHPTFPSVHLGYLEIGEKLGEIDGFDYYEFVRHIEKPDFSSAEKFLEKGNYLWNTGYFVWKLSTIMKLFQKYTPTIFESLEKISSAVDSPSEETVLDSEYQKIERQSVDKALFEKLEKGEQLEIPAVLGWTDVGAWDVLKDELAEALEHNVTRGEHIDVGSKDLLVHNEQGGKIIATVGLESLIIVDTPDALLICRKDRAQDVKKIVQELKESEKKHYL
jgi:mannose-1-phosphate guanylyltransferase